MNSDKIILFLLFAAIPFLAFIWIRNKIIWNSFLTLVLALPYERWIQLPDQHIMVLHPKFWLLWTPYQWRSWLERKEYKDDLRVVLKRAKASHDRHKINQTRDELFNHKDRGDK